MFTRGMRFLVLCIFAEINLKVWIVTSLLVCGVSWIGLSLSETSYGTVTGDEPNPNRAGRGLLWRTEGYDDVNCLYMLLELSGIQIEYSELLATAKRGDPENSFLDLRNLLMDFGVPSSVFSCRLSDLTRCHMPVIVLVDNPRERGAAYYLIFNVTDRKVDMINGGLAVIEEQSIDDFRRSWSGYVLVPENREPPWLLSLGVGILVIVTFWWWRVRPLQSGRTIR